jgi:uncharacterized phage infection (PIP) family protein YhgE
MSLRDFFSGGGWLRSRTPEIDEEGLISQEQEGEPTESEETVIEESESEYSPSDAPVEDLRDEQEKPQDNKVVVKAIEPLEKHPSTPGLEKLQDGLNNLVQQLQGINENLTRQASQHQDLMSRIEQLPQLLESLPAAVENQKHSTEMLLEQLKANAAKDQQFMETVEKIPTETGKQTDALVNINHQLAAAADTDVQMAENFNKFNQTLDKLDESTLSQTDSIMQMSKTFAASDRYLKYIISRQNKRFLWVLVSAITVCMVVVLILAGIIIYLRR